VHAALRGPMFGSMGNTKTKAARRSREQWVAEIARWRKSGLNSTEYAREHGLNRSTLLGWSFKAGPAAAQPETSTPARFLPVRIRERDSAKSGNSSASQIEIVLTNGRLLRVAGAVDASELARVLAAVEGGIGC